MGPDPNLWYQYTLSHADYSCWVPTEGLTALSLGSVHHSLHCLGMFSLFCLSEIYKVIFPHNSLSDNWVTTDGPMLLSWSFPSVRATSLIQQHHTSKAQEGKDRKHKSQRDLPKPWTVSASPTGRHRSQTRATQNPHRQNVLLVLCFQNCASSRKHHFLILHNNGLLNQGRRFNKGWSEVEFQQEKKHFKMVAASRTLPSRISYPRGSWLHVPWLFVFINSKVNRMTLRSTL